MSVHQSTAAASSQSTPSPSTLAARMMASGCCVGCGMEFNGAKCNYAQRCMSSQKYNPIPVIIGAGQVNDRDEPGSPSLGLDSLGLMEAALRAADSDAGGGWLPRLDSLGAVDQISCPELGDVSAPLAARVGAAPRICYKSGYASGDS